MLVRVCSSNNCLKIKRSWQILLHKNKNCSSLAFSLLYGVILGLQWRRKLIPYWSFLVGWFLGFVFVLRMTPLALEAESGLELRSCWLQSLVLWLENCREPFWGKSHTFTAKSRLTQTVIMWPIQGVAKGVGQVRRRGMIVLIHQWWVWHTKFVLVLFGWSVCKKDLLIPFVSWNSFSLSYQMLQLRHSLGFCPDTLSKYTWGGKNSLNEHASRGPCTLPLPLVCQC